MRSRLELRPDFDAPKLWPERQLTTVMLLMVELFERLNARLEDWRQMTPWFLVAEL